MASAKVELPPELILEIFLRLPTKSLERLSPVLDNHPVLAGELQSASFRHKHALMMMSQPANQQLFIQSRELYCHESIGYAFVPPKASRRTHVPPKEIYNFLQLFKDSFPYDKDFCDISYEVIGACNGLVCLLFAFFKNTICSCCDMDDYWRNQIILWNPCTGEHHALPPSPNLIFEFEDGSFDEDDPLPGFGFGYDVLNDTYKVVMGKNSVTEIYNLSTNEWQIDDKVNINWGDFDYFNNSKSYSMAQFGQYLNGSLHWIVSKTTIFRIDLSTMASTRINVPPSCSSELSNADHELKLGVLSGCLSVACFRSQAKEVGIWVMEEYGGRQRLWTNMFTVRSPDSFDIGFEKLSLWMSLNENKMLLVFKGHFGFWNVSAKKFKYVKNRTLGLDRGLVHVDTLVSPKPEDYRHSIKRRSYKANLVGDQCDFFCQKNKRLKKDDNEL